MSRSTISTFQLFAMFPDKESARLTPQSSPPSVSRGGSLPQRYRGKRQNEIKIKPNFRNRQSGTVTGYLRSAGTHDAVTRPGDVTRANLIPHCAACGATGLDIAYDPNYREGWDVICCAS